MTMPTRLTIIALVLAILPFGTARADEPPKEVTIVPPLVVSTVARASWDRSTPESSYFGIYTANKTADAAWIIDGFVPQDRDIIRKRVSDKAMLDANTALFESIQQEKITKKVVYGPYVILVVEARRLDGRRFLRNLPMKRAGAEWLLTNELASDTVFLGLKSGFVDR